MTERCHRRVRTWAASAAAAAVLVLGGLSACSGSEQQTQQPPPATNGGTTAPGEPMVLRLGVSRPDPNRPGAGLDTLDPADVVPTNQADMIAVDLLFESLTTIDPATNEAKPALAASMTPNADSTLWTVTLRSGLVFSDGSPITAADVKFTLERIARKGVSSLPGASLDVVAGYAELLTSQDANAELAGVKVVDPRTLTIATSEPFAGLPELLASPLFGIVPKAVVATSAGQFGTKPVGSGAYAFVDSSDEKVDLARAKDATAHVERIELVKFADRDAVLAAMRERKVDWAELPASQTTPPSGDLGTPMPGPRSSEAFFAFNLGSATYANDALRQAIVKAVNRQQLATAVLQSTQLLNGVVPLAVAGGQADPCGAVCTYDPEGAKALLAQAFPDGNIPTVQIDIYSGATESAKTQQAQADAISADLAAAGIPNAIRPKPFEEYRLFAVNGDRQLFSYGWVGLAPDPDFFVSRLFLSTSPDNVTGYKNPDIDGAIRAARATSNRASRIQQYQAIETAIMGSVPIVPLAVLDSSVIVGPAVSGYTSRFDGTFVVDAITIKR